MKSITHISTALSYGRQILKREKADKNLHRMVKLFFKKLKNVDHSNESQ